MKESSIQYLCSFQKNVQILFSQFALPYAHTYYGYVYIYIINITQATATTYVHIIYSCYMCPIYAPITCMFFPLDPLPCPFAFLTPFQLSPPPSPRISHLNEVIIDLSLPKSAFKVLKELFKYINADYCTLTICNGPINKK